MRNLISILILLLPALNLYGQHKERVSIEYTYYVPQNLTIEEAKYNAIENAKIQIIGDTFGTTISQESATTVSESGGKGETDFYSIGKTEIKGEWIETIGEPVFDVAYKEEKLIVKVFIEGYIREIQRAKTDFTMKILCNGTENKDERDVFHDGDALYLYAKSPVNGHLVVYLVDVTTHTAYCLLPYKRSSLSAVPLRHDTPYIFFSKKKADKQSAPDVDEYILKCQGNQELNILYAIFSPNQFAKANSQDNQTLLPRELSQKDFQQWLAKMRNRDKDCQVEQRTIIIKK